MNRIFYTHFPLPYEEVTDFSAQWKALSLRIYYPLASGHIWGLNTALGRYLLFPDSCLTMKNTAEGCIWKCPCSHTNYGIFSTWRRQYTFSSLHVHSYYQSSKLLRFVWRVHWFLFPSFCTFLKASTFWIEEGYNSLK